MGEAKLNPWPSVVGGPRFLIGAWASGIWIERAARQYDGWIASGGRTNFQTMREGIQRYRDLGGQRAIVATVSVDLSQPEADLAEDRGFNLVCGPQSARERVARVAELGYDDLLVVKAVRPGGPFQRYEPDLTEEELQGIRALLP